MFRIQTRQKAKDGIIDSNFLCQRYDVTHGQGFAQIRLYESITSPAPAVTCLVRHDAAVQARIIYKGEVIEEHNAPIPPAEPQQENGDSEEV